MYVAAALCLWFLRAWKIGQLEELAVEQEKSLEGIDAVHDQPSRSSVSASSKAAKSSVLKRLSMWKKV